MFRKINSVKAHFEALNSKSLNFDELTPTLKVKNVIFPKT